MEPKRFIWKALISIGATAAVCVSFLEAPHPSGLFLEIFLPVYLLTMPSFASASFRFGRLLGYETERRSLLVLAGYATADAVPAILLVRAARKNALAGSASGQVRE